jgi:hypothetical protein
MTIKQTLKMLWEDPLNVWYWFQGTFRQYLFDNCPVLIREHILDQYLYRMSKAPECSRNRSCIFCGCKTNDLFFADKACGLSKLTDANIKIFGKDTYCYPKMMSKQKWNNFKQLNNF